MKLAVLSDIHGNLPALEAVIADAQAAGCDRFVNLGDSLSGPLWPRETAERLIALGWPTLAGNQERQLLTLPLGEMGPSDRFARAALEAAHLAWLASLPGTLALSDEIFLCHGTPASDLIYLLEEVDAEGARPADAALVRDRLGGRAEALILCGHSHLPRIVHVGDQVVANPGSVGLPAYADTAPFPHAMEAGSPHARYAIVSDGDVALRAVTYDHEAAAAKAEREGRPDWAVALRTGRVTGRAQAA